MRCPCCKGECQFMEDRIAEYDILIDCGYCNGTGRVSLWKLIKWWLYLF